jgi:hypothetical protein
VVVRAADRRLLRQVYAFACGYCGITETDNGSELTVDHYHPIAHGGTDDITNLVYACHACNGFKRDYWQFDESERVLHPLNDKLEEHINEAEDGTLHGLTAIGRFHISLLKLNRFPLIHYRQRRRFLQENSMVNARLSDEVAGLKGQLNALLRRIDKNAPTE